MKNGYAELTDAREIKTTEKAILLDYGIAGTKKEQKWFPKKAITYEDGKYGVAIWFKKSMGVSTSTKTELVNKFEKKRLIQVQPQGSLDFQAQVQGSFVEVAEHVIKTYAEYRKGTANSGRILSDAVDELERWIINEKDKEVKKSTVNIC